MVKTILLFLFRSKISNILGVKSQSFIFFFFAFSSPLSSSPDEAVLPLEKRTKGRMGKEMEIRTVCNLFGGRKRKKEAFLKFQSRWISVTWLVQGRPWGKTLVSSVPPTTRSPNLHVICMLTATWLIPAFCLFSLSLHAPAPALLPHEGQFVTTSRRTTPHYTLLPSTNCSHAPKSLPPQHAKFPALPSAWPSLCHSAAPTVPTSLAGSPWMCCQVEPCKEEEALALPPACPAAYG